MKLTIIIPTYNEQELIEKVIKSIPMTSLKVMGYDVEILIVNTSTDKTETIAKELGATVINETRRGYGRAYKTGFEYVKEGLITTFDADLTYPPNEIIKMLNVYEQHKNEFIFISGNRFSRPDHEAFTWLNKFGNHVFNILIRLLFGVTLKDSQSGMWLTTKEAINELELYEDGMPLSPEIKLAAKQKLEFIEVPIGYRKRPNYAKLKPIEDGKKILKFLLDKKFKPKLMHIRV